MERVGNWPNSGFHRFVAQGPYPADWSGPPMGAIESGEPVGSIEHGNPSHSWMAWHMRAVARATGLPEAKVDQDYLRQCLTYVRDLVRGQLDFHRDNAHRSEHLDHRLHVGALWLMFATVLAILVHLVGLLGEWPPLHHSAAGPLLHWLHGLGPLTILCCGAFPALGAALHGIKNQGELARIAKRSQAMEAQLAMSLKEIDEKLGSKEPLRWVEAVALARGTADLLVDEVLDWRVIFLDRPPALPA